MGPCGKSYAVCVRSLDDARRSEGIAVLPQGASRALQLAAYVHARLAASALAEVLQSAAFQRRAPVESCEGAALAAASQFMRRSGDPHATAHSRRSYEGLARALAEAGWDLRAVKLRAASWRAVWATDLLASDTAPGTAPHGTS